MSKEFYRAVGRTDVWPELTHQHPSELTYDDVILAPRERTTIESRGEVQMHRQIGPFLLEIPIISAPMDTVSGEEMLRELHRLGAIGTLPRGDLSTRLNICERLSNEGVRGIYAVRHRRRSEHSGEMSGVEEAQLLAERGARVILVDVAHGGMQQVMETARDIKELRYGLAQITEETLQTAVDIQEKMGLTVIAGNIVTYEQACAYKEYGIDIARVGVGPGGVCKTRQVAGTGFPQLSAIFETSESGIMVIADGGIRYPGDVAKALAAGADYVMIGSMFAGTDEAPGEVIEKDGQSYKLLRGQASRQYMNDHGVSLTRHRAEEGVAKYVPYKGAVEHLVLELSGGLASAMSYQGARTLDEFYDLSRFQTVSKAALDEGKPHA
ncbi:MAG: guanosine monophosphate reductase [Patescibacteria group bacterium]